MNLRWLGVSWPPGQRKQHAGAMRSQAWKGPGPAGRRGFMGTDAGVFDQPAPGAWGWGTFLGQQSH